MHYADRKTGAPEEEEVMAKTSSIVGSWLHELDRHLQLLRLLLCFMIIYGFDPYIGGPAAAAVHPGQL